MMMIIMIYFSVTITVIWISPSLVSSEYRELYPWVVRRPGCEASHLPPSNAEANNVEDIPPLLHTSSLHGV
jgi:hypothetical protein